MAKWLWRRFLNFIKIFCYLVIISPRKGVWPYIWTSLKRIHFKHLNKLEYSSPMNALCQVWLKLAQKFWRRGFLNFGNVFSLFRHYLPLVSFAQTWILFIHECFVSSLVEIDPEVLEKSFLKFRQCIFAISSLSPLGKRRGPSCEQTWIPFNQRSFVPIFFTAVLEKIFKSPFPYMIFTFHLKRNRSF